MGFDGMNITHWMDLMWFNGMFMGFTWVLHGFLYGFDDTWDGVSMDFYVFFGMLVMDFLGFGLG